MSDRPRILIVDDSPENIHILLEVLKEQYQVTAAKDGEKALLMAHQQPQPDLILLDVMMPGMSGYEVCGILNDDEMTSDIPIIFVTALTEDEDEARGFMVGAVDYITKPISPPIVKARVSTHLSLKAARKRLEDQNKKLIEAAELREDVERITRHDLKGPLSTVISLPPLLMRKENITDYQKDILGLIRESGYLMLEMINNSLNLYKMEVGTYSYQPESVDLVEVVNRVFAECENLCDAHCVELQLCVNDSNRQNGRPFFVYAEELLCYTMLSNLIKNAIEASPENATVKVQFEEVSGISKIVIQNAGEVPENVRERFFEKYTTAGKTDGTGLGTYSAYIAARTQDGDITLDSSVPGQTSVTVSLKTARQDS